MRAGIQSYVSNEAEINRSTAGDGLGVAVARSFDVVWQRFRKPVKANTTPHPTTTVDGIVCDIHGSRTAHAAINCETCDEDPSAHDAETEHCAPCTGFS